MAITKPYTAQDILWMETPEIGLADLPEDTAVGVMDLPNGASIVMGEVIVTQAFNAGTADILDVGDSGSANRYLNDGNINAIGRVALVPTGFVNTGKTTITLTRDKTGTAPTQGKLILRVGFVINGRSSEVFE